MPGGGGEVDEFAEVFRRPFFTGVDDGVGADIRDEFCEFLQVRREGGIWSGGAFDFDKVYAAVFFDEEVGLKSAVVAEIPEILTEFAVEVVLDEIHHDEVFEETAAEGVAGDLGGRSYAEEVGGESDVGEIDFRGFDEAFAEVAVKWVEVVDDEACFEHGEPAFEGFGVGADVPGEGLEIDDLSYATRKETEKRLEGVLIADLDELADVALDIGAVIFFVCVGRVETVGIDSREKSAVDEIVARRGETGGGKFFNGEWEEGDESGSSGERL